MIKSACLGEKQANLGITYKFFNDSAPHCIESKFNTLEEEWEGPKIRSWFRHSVVEIKETGVEILIKLAAKQIECFELSHPDISLRMHTYYLYMENVQQIICGVRYGFRFSINYFFYFTWIYRICRSNPIFAIFWCHIIVVARET